MELTMEQLQLIANDWFDINNRVEYSEGLKELTVAYRIMKIFPCVMSSDKESFIRALGKVASAIGTNFSFIDEARARSNYIDPEEKMVKMEHIISYAIIDTYGETGYNASNCAIHGYDINGKSRKRIK